MLKQAQQFALWQAAGATSIVAGYEALSGLDPLLCWIVQRRLRKLLQRAALATTLSDPRHQLLLAYVLGTGSGVAEPDSVAEVEARAFAHPPPASAGPGGLWVSGGLLLLLLMLGVTAFGIRQWRRPFSPLATASGDLLGRQLSAHVMALANRDAKGAANTRAELLSRSPQALGERAARELGAVLGGMSRLASQVGQPAPELVQAYERGVVRLDAELRAAGHPYFLDAELLSFGDRVQPLLMSYYVQAEARVAHSKPNIRVVRLWRLDNLDVAQGGIVGFTRPDSDAAIVLLDQAEESLVRVTLPAAAPNGRVELVDDQTRGNGEGWVTAVEESATKLTLAYYRSLGPARAAEAMRIGTLLLRRRNLVRNWQASLRGLGLELSVPRRLFPDVDYAKQLWLKIPRDDLEDWQQLQAELRERLPAFEELRETFVQAVEQHEVQHRLDYARGSLPVPEFLCRMTSCGDRREVVDGSLVARARDETSAYLAEVARTPGSPKAELIVLSPLMLDSSLQQGAAPYSFAAITVYVALAKALGIDADAVLGRGTIGRQWLAELAILVWGRSDAELRVAARHAYLTEFETALPEVELEGRKANTRFRPEL